MVSFTPGPWIYGEDGSVRGKDGWCIPFYSGFIEGAYYAEDGTNESKANAQLISAAPDLLEASENLLFRIRNIGYWNKPDTEMYIKALEAAVARAKGNDHVQPKP